MSNTGRYGIWNRKFFLAMTVLFVLAACFEKNREDLILSTISKLGDYAEKKDLANILLHVAEDYTDFQGRDKLATQNMLRSYFSDYRGIVIHMLGSRVSLDDTLQASFQMEILVSSGGAKIFRKMMRFAGDLYRIQGRMIEEDGRWEIMYAEWDSIHLEDLFPESLSALKHLFPQL